MKLHFTTKDETITKLHFISAKFCKNKVACDIAERAFG
jgi:hypothetical protein